MSGSHQKAENFCPRGTATAVQLASISLKRALINQSCRAQYYKLTSCLQRESCVSSEGILEARIPTDRARVQTERNSITDGRQWS